MQAGLLGARSAGYGWHKCTQKVEDKPSLTKLSCSAQSSGQTTNARKRRGAGAQAEGEEGARGRMWGETKMQDARVHVEHGMDLEIQELH